MAGFNLATPPVECKPFPGYENFHHLLIQGRERQTNYDINSGITTAFGGFNGSISVVNSLLDV